MSKIKFPFQVKYEGKYYTANMPFEAEEKDLQELISIGGKVVANVPLKTKKASKTKRENEQ